MALNIRCKLAHVQQASSGGLIVETIGEDLIRLIRGLSPSQMLEAVCALNREQIAGVVSTRHAEILPLLENDTLLKIARTLPASVIRTVAREVGNAVNEPYSEASARGKPESAEADKATGTPPIDLSPILKRDGTSGVNVDG